jgi:hypothetical protein
MVSPCAAAKRPRASFKPTPRPISGGTSSATMRVVRERDARFIETSAPAATNPLGRVKQCTATYHCCHTRRRDRFRTDSPTSRLSKHSTHTLRTKDPRRGPESVDRAPKTLKAVRTIPLGHHAVAALTSHCERVTRTAPGDLVFANQKGKPLRESKVLRNVLQPAAEKAGLGRVTWHQFRHIHSSLLNDLRVPVKIAQEQLGHASVSTTLNIYTHVVDASHRKAVEAVEERIFGETDCFGLKSSTAVDQSQPASPIVH